MLPHPSRSPASLAHEDGFFLVEILVAAALVLVIGAGVLLALQGAEATSAQARAKAVAANLAEQEVDRLRSLRLVDLQAFLPGGAGTAPTTRTVGSETYELRTRADWASATDGGTGCGQAGTTADYLKLTVTVTPERPNARPFALETVLTPSARAAAGQGGAKVEITDRAANGVGGLTVTLAGPQTQSAMTDAEGCVQFSYLPAGSYSVSFGRPGWVDPKGSETVSDPLDVPNQETATAAYRYDVGQAAHLSFWSRRGAGSVGGLALAADATQVRTSFATAYLSHSENDASRAVELPPPTTTPPTQAMSRLFPFESPYTVWPGRCAPPAPALGTGTLTAGVTATSAASPLSIRVPALDVTLKWPGLVSDVAEAQVVVTTACGERIGPRAVRLTDAHVVDPGFPYGTSLTVCAQARLKSSGQTRHRALTGQRNDRLDGTPVLVDLSTGTTTGACP